MINLGEVGSLARALVDAEDEVEAAEARLKVLKERERKIREEDLPAALEEVGLQKVRLATGEEVSVKLEVYCAVPVAMKPRMFQWLEDHGHGGLIKTELGLRFGRDDDEKERLEMVARTLQDMGANFEVKQDVHAQTMKAWLKSQLEDAEKAALFPLELFGARPVNTAKVKRK